MRPAALASEALDRAIVIAPLTVAPDTSVASAAALMAAAATAPHPHAASRGSCVLVLATGAPPALLAERDVVRLVTAGVPLDRTPAGTVAVPARCAPRSALLHHTTVLALMGEAGHLVVLDDAGAVVGLITPASMLAAQIVPPPQPPDQSEHSRDADDPEQSYARSLLAVLDVTDDIFVSVAGDGRITFMNKTARALLGFAPDEDVTSQHIASLHPPETNERIQREIIPQIATTGAWEGESSYVSRAGVVFPIRQVIVAHSAPNGTLTHLSTIAHDLRERRRAEQELRESEERVRLALVASSQGLYDLNIQTGEAVVTPEYATMLGYDPASFHETNQRWLERLHPDDVERVGAIYRAYIAGELPVYSVEFRQRTRDGGWKWILSLGKILARDAAGRPLRMLGTHTDITARKEAEEALRELNHELERRVAERTRELMSSQERLSLAARSAALGIWDWDIAAGKLTWDQRMYELYGLTPETLGSDYASWTGALHPDDRAATEAAIQDALSGERELDTEFRVYHPDGSVWALKANGLVQRGPAGEPLRMIGVNYDVTARRQAEDKLRATGAQLAAANHELQAFAYSVSHDLRAPLRAIDGFSQALIEDYGQQLDDEARGYLTRIRGGVRRMSQLIDDLLALSRVSRAEMSSARVDLSALVAHVADELREASPERVVELVIAPGVVAWGDARLLRVAIDNLLANAWKFTSRHPRARIEFGVTQAGGRPVYFVRDDGAGYDPAYANKLFGVFQRLHDTHEFPGTGIGLATVQRVIHRHGGQLWSEGVIEQGATFYFTLPGGTFREERRNGQ